MIFDKSSLASKTYKRLLLASISTITVVLTFARATAISPSGADIGVWVNIQEWLARGNHTYVDVWDHKDWGFYQVIRPFYSVANIQGVYFSGVFATSMFAYGLFVFLRELTSRRRASALCMIGTTFYVLAPSYLAPYTENYAISLTIVGASQLRRRPVLSGVIFALAISVKLSSWIPWICSLGVLALIHIVSAQPILDRKFWRDIFLNVTGLLFGLALVILACTLEGGLRGWLDVITYNREYANIRRGGTSIWANFNISDVSILLFLISLTFVVLGALFLSLVSVAPTSQDARTPFSLSLSKAMEAIGVSGVLVLGSLTALLFQSPPRPHHFQFLIGPFVVLSCVALAIAFEQCTSRISLLLLFGLLVTPVWTLRLVTPQSISTRPLIDGLERWKGLNDVGELSSELEKIPRGQTVALFGGNSSRLDVRALPADTSLGCRFVFQYSHLFPHYERDMKLCTKAGVSVVVVENSPDWGTDEYRNLVHQELKTSYHFCGPQNASFSIWFSKELDCG